MQFRIHQTFTGAHRYNDLFFGSTMSGLYSSALWERSKWQEYFPLHSAKNLLATATCILHSAIDATMCRIKIVLMYWALLIEMPLKIPFAQSSCKACFVFSPREILLPGKRSLTVFSTAAFPLSSTLSPPPPCTQCIGRRSSGNKWLLRSL